jgi:S1-C subfamily serine protease
MKYPIVLGSILISSFFVSPVAFAQVENTRLKSIDDAIAREIASDPLTASVRKVLPSVLSITIISKKIIGGGTGIIVSKNGFILTNKHVVHDNQSLYFVTMPDGSQKRAHVWYRDPDQDFALLKVDATFPTSSIATLGTSSSLKIGQRVGAIGNANGLYKNAISAGTIVGFNKSIHASAGDIEEYLSGLIESTLPLTVGYSGGPLVTTNGTVVGLSVAADNRTNHSYSIPIDQIKSKIQGYLKSSIK